MVRLLCSLMLAALLAAFVVPAAHAQAATAPDWVAITPPNAAFLKCYKTTLGDRRLSLIEVTTTTTACTFSVWSAVTGAYVKIKPLWGRVATDSVITVPPYTTKAYKFPWPRADGIYVTAGGTTSYFSGE